MQGEPQPLVLPERKVSAKMLLTAYITFADSLQLQRVAGCLRRRCPMFVKLLKVLALNQSVSNHLRFEFCFSMGDPWRGLATSYFQKGEKWCCIMRHDHFMMPRETTHVKLMINRPMMMIHDDDDSMMMMIHDDDDDDVVVWPLDA